MKLNLPTDFLPDRVSLQDGVLPHTRYTVAELEGAGCIRHFWISLGKAPELGRETLLRIYFDGNPEPYVEAPVGDFFGVMHGQAFYPINTEFIAVLEREGRNCYFPMPFENGARIEIETGELRADISVTVDWHRFESMPEKRRFCARWHRENPTESYGREFLMLDAEGPGELAGFFYAVRLLDYEDRWSHGGSENIYIDGETENPIYIRGLGGEDTFGGSFGGAMHKPETMLYTGMPYYTHEDDGKPRPAPRLTGYRFFKHDRIPFKKTVTMRFGCMKNDICATVYWYSEKTPKPFFRMTHESVVNPPRVSLGEVKWKVFGPIPNRCDLDANALISAGLQGDFSLVVPLGDVAYGADARKDARWLDGLNERGFLDFRRYFRVRKGGVSPTEPGSALAVCDLIASCDGEAQIRVTYDDQMTLTTKDEQKVLPNHRAFRNEDVRLKLKKGKNRIAILLTNTQNSNKGGWCFALNGTDAKHEKLQIQFPNA